MNCGSTESERRSKCRVRILTSYRNWYPIPSLEDGIRASEGWLSSEEFDSDGPCVDYGSTVSDLEIPQQARERVYTELLSLVRIVCTASVGVQGKVQELRQRSD